MDVRGITVCVGCAHLLATTLPRNIRHLSDCVVVTSPKDHDTWEVCRSVPGVRIFGTDAGTRHGARFNKGLCMEEGFDFLGRHGQILIWDADILFPPTIPWGLVRHNSLNGCRRRILNDPARFRDDLDWRTCPIHRDGGPIGFFQLFNADDPALAKKPYWYDPTFAHAGGSDAYFMTHWGPGHRCVLPFDVLHLGKPNVNWFGPGEHDRDMMARFVHEHCWRGAMRDHSQESAARSGEIIHRVEVPGYTSTYELPFVKRAQRR